MGSKYMFLLGIKDTLETNKTICYIYVEPKKHVLHIFRAQQTARLKPEMVILDKFIRNTTKM